MRLQLENNFRLEFLEEIGKNLLRWSQGAMFCRVQVMTTLIIERSIDLFFFQEFRFCFDQADNRYQKTNFRTPEQSWWHVR